MYVCREPDRILPPGVPRLLLSESDFHDPDRRDGGGHWLLSCPYERPSRGQENLVQSRIPHWPDRQKLRCSAGGSLKPWGLPKEYDIFYSCQGGEWNDYARNWTLAKASFKRLITELNIKVGTLCVIMSCIICLSGAACVTCCSITRGAQVRPLQQNVGDTGGLRMPGGCAVLPCAGRCHGKGLDKARGQ